jgi:hypothetical protein
MHGIMQLLPWRLHRLHRPTECGEIRCICWPRELSPCLILESSSLTPVARTRPFIGGWRGRVGAPQDKIRRRAGVWRSDVALVGGGTAFLSWSRPCMSVLLSRYVCGRVLCVFDGMPTMPTSISRTFIRGKDGRGTRYEQARLRGRHVRIPDARRLIAFIEKAKKISCLTA